MGPIRYVEMRIEDFFEWLTGDPYWLRHLYKPLNFIWYVIGTLVGGYILGMILCHLIVAVCT